MSDDEEWDDEDCPAFWISVSMSINPTKFPPFVGRALDRARTVAGWSAARALPRIHAWRCPECRLIVHVSDAQLHARTEHPEDPYVSLAADAAS